MIPIERQAAVDLLRRDPYRYLGDLIALDLNMPPIPRTVFGDAEVPSAIAVVEEWPWGIGASASSFDVVFLGEFLDWLSERHEEFGLGSTDRRVLDYASDRPDLEVGPVSCTRSFACASLERVPEMSPACKLTEDDAPAVEQYPAGHRNNGPELPTLFQWFVIEGKGEIYACKDGNEIVGFLSCAREWENIWDVDFIHLRDEARGRGLGTRLAATYARTLLTRGDIPYYSGARNEASERTATSAGFHCCRELFVADVSRKE